MGETVISIKDLSKSFGNHEVLRKIDIDIEAGEIICIVGSSGSGKSTLLRCINKLERQTSGKILYMIRKSGMYRRTSMNTAPGWEWYFSPLTYLTI